MLSTNQSKIESNDLTEQSAKKTLAGLISTYYQGISASLALSVHTKMRFASIVCFQVDSCSQNEQIIVHHEEMSRHELCNVYENKPLSCKDGINHTHPSLYTKSYGQRNVHFLMEA